MSCCPFGAYSCATLAFICSADLHLVEIAVATAGETRAGLRRGTRHFAMAADESLRKQPLELYQQQKQLVALCLGPRVLRPPLGVEPALVAHADGTAVVRAAMGAHLKQAAVLGHLAVAPDVEVVADGAELTCLVVGGS